MQTRYPIRAVAKITGLSLDTLRAWERRYQAVVPERTDRGRQYGPEQIERLLLLSQLVQRGHAIGGIASLADEELKKLLESVPAPSSVSGASAVEADPLPALEMLAPVLAAVERFDASLAADELGRLAAVLAPRDLVYKVTLPLIREVGIRWHNGTMVIAQEHLVSQMLRNLLGNMVRLYRPSNPALKMILATPSGESHEFGILAAAMLASMAGIEPVYLGADLPVAEIAATARRVSAGVVLLGITLVSDTTARDVKLLADSMPEDAELWIGGAGRAQVDLSNLGRKIVLLNDLSSLEAECSRWRN